MNPEVKAKWVAALRSGDYRQGRQKLAIRRTATELMAHCCLGVLCELAVAEEIIEARMTPFGTGNIRNFGKDTDWHSTALPVAVQEWAGLTGKFRNDPVLKEQDGWQLCASELNDGNVSIDVSVHTFEQIADLIEENESL